MRFLILSSLRFLSRVLGYTHSVPFSARPSTPRAPTRKRGGGTAHSLLSSPLNIHITRRLAQRNSHHSHTRACHTHAQLIVIVSVCARHAPKRPSMCLFVPHTCVSSRSVLRPSFICIPPPSPQPKTPAHTSARRPPGVKKSWPGVDTCPALQ